MDRWKQPICVAFIFYLVSEYIATIICDKNEHSAAAKQVAFWENYLMKTKWNNFVTFV